MSDDASTACRRRPKAVLTLGARPRFRHIAMFALCALSACTGATEPASTTHVADPLLDRAQRDGTVVVVVELLVPKGSAASVQTVAIEDAQRRLMRELGPGARVVERFGRKVPQIMLRVNAEALGELRQSERVVTISLAEPPAPNS